MFWLLCYEQLFWCLMQAEQRAREESERLRQQERELIAEKRRRDLVCSHLVYNLFSLLLLKLISVFVLIF